MNHNSQHGLSCTEFELRLSEALDGVLSPAEQEEFRRHAEACMDCGELFTRAHAGMTFLQGLEEVEPPATLTHNILAATVYTAAAPRASSGREKKTSWLRRAADWIAPGLAPAMARAMQPRFAMTTAMAFFSITLVVNIAGLKWADLSKLDLRPSAISTEASLQYHETTARIVKYYENIRFVYELETRVRELRRAAGTEDDTQPQPQQQQQPQKDQQDRRRKPGDDSSREQKQQNRNQNQQYSQSNAGVELAVLRTYGPGNELAEIRRDA